MVEPLFKVSGLKVALPDMTRKPLFGSAPKVEILKGLDFELPRRSVTGIVGESGSGKSTLGRALVRLIEPTEGSITFDGRDITHLPETELQTAATQFADDLPGPDVVAQSAPDDRRDHRRTAEAKRPWRQPQRPRRGGIAAGRPAASISPSAIATKFRAASASVSGSRAHSHCRRISCSPTRSSRGWMSRPRRKS